MNPIYTLRSHTNELRLYEDHLEGEFIGKEIVATPGARFFCVLYSEIESVEITELPDSQMNVLEIRYSGKPHFDKKHLHPSNILFRQAWNKGLACCIKVECLIEHLKENPFNENSVQALLGSNGTRNKGPGRINVLERDKQSKSFSFFGLL